jgi:hypothetical protein
MKSLDLNLPASGAVVATRATTAARRLHASEALQG